MATEAQQASIAVRTNLSLVSDLVKAGRPVAADCEGLILDDESGDRKSGLGRVSVVD